MNDGGMWDTKILKVYRPEKSFTSQLGDLVPVMKPGNM